MTVAASKYALKPNDLYETEPWATQAVCRVLRQLGLAQNGRTVWEPAAGNHKMVEPLLEAGAKTVITSDICEYSQPHTATFDFLKNGVATFVPTHFDIVSNPPYGPSNRLAVKFAEQALTRCNGYVALLLTAKFDFGSTRKHLFRDNPRFAAKVALLDRISWEDNGKTGTEDHAWYIWGPREDSVSCPKLMYERNLAKL